MADFDPDAFLSSPAAPAAGGFDPDAFLKGSGAPASEGVGTSLARAVTDIPHEIYQAGAAGLHEMNAVNPWGQERTEARARGEAPGMLDLPRAVMGGLGTVASPITGATRAVGGHLLDLLNRGMRAGAVKLYGEDKVRQAEAATGTTNGYEAAKGDVDKLMMGLGPKGGMRPAPVALPSPPPTGPLGVTLSEGQATQALPAIQREQSALANRLGPTAMDRAKQFETQQQGQVQAAQEGVRSSFDQFGQVVADNPQEAGQLVSQGVQQAAAAKKADVDAAYTHARSLPGEVHADAFKDIGARIKDDLSNRPEPIVIDDGLTPFASKAIQDVDSRIGQLQIQNRASATGQPPQNTIMGVTLNGIDQMRKRLVSFRNQAFGNNKTDGMAAKAVINAFDDHIDNAINSGMFTGDQRAVQAWNNARAAHSDYAKTFKAGPGDPVGRVVEKIIGKYTNDPMIPNKVADQLYGAQGTSASDTNVGVANRVKKILGDQSPEWSAVKQGLFSRLTETTEGVTDWGSQKVSSNIYNFLNGKGKELSEAVYTPQERQLLQQYADLHKQLVVPPKGAQPSNTSTMVAPLLRKIGSRVGTAIGFGAGALLGHSTGLPFGSEIGAGVGAGIAKIGDAAANAREAAQISKQMPLIAQSTQRYQKALAAAQRANSPPSQRALAVATANLAKSLQPLGIDFRKLNTVQGPAPASADENQRQRGGRTNAKPDQGEGGKAHGFAHGGRVDPDNIDHAPTEGQKKAGNYAKDHVNIHGLDITVENAKGAERSGVGRDGNAWSVKMPAHYGYIKGTVGKDKDHVDVYIGPHAKSSRVFVIDQMDAETKKFDEHKAFLGFASKAQVIATYRKAFSDGRAQERMGHLAEMDISQFKHWLDSGNTTKPVADHETKKLSHLAVGYVAKSRIPNKHCSACSMYQPGPHCSLVRDPISPGGWCRRFDPKKD